MTLLYLTPWHVVNGYVTLLCVSAESLLQIHASSKLKPWLFKCKKNLGLFILTSASSATGVRQLGFILTLCLVRADMLVAIACSQSRLSSSAGHWITPLQTPSTAMTWKAFFLKNLESDRKRKDIWSCSSAHHANIFDHHIKYQITANKIYLITVYYILV